MSLSSTKAVLTGLHLPNWHLHHLYENYNNANSSCYIKCKRGSAFLMRLIDRVWIYCEVFNTGRGLWKPWVWWKQVCADTPALHLTLFLQQLIYAALKEGKKKKNRLRSLGCFDKRLSASCFKSVQLLWCLIINICVVFPTRRFQTGQYLKSSAEMI